MRGSAFCTFPRNCICFLFAMKPLLFRCLNRLFALTSRGCFLLHKCGFSINVRQTMLLMPGLDKNSLRSNNCLSPGNLDKALSATYIKKILHLLVKNPAPACQCKQWVSLEKAAAIKHRKRNI